MVHVLKKIFHGICLSTNTGGFSHMWEFEVYSYENLHKITVVVLNIRWNLSEIRTIETNDSEDVFEMLFMNLINQIFVNFSYPNGYKH
jgi:hypothetical protein